MFVMVQGKPYPVDSIDEIRRARQALRKADIQETDIWTTDRKGKVASSGMRLKKD